MVVPPSVGILIIGIYTLYYWVDEFIPYGNSVHVGCLQPLPVVILSTCFIFHDLPSLVPENEKVLAG